MTAPGFSLRQLETFLAVADTGSITAAAEALHGSPSGVAAGLDALERTLGVQLCVRRRAHGVTLTARGRELQRSARDLLAEAAELERAIGGGRTGLRGEVTIGCAEEMAPGILPPIVERLALDHPGVALEVRIGLEESFWPRLLTGEIDLAITLDHRQPTELESVRLTPLPLIVVLPADHPLAAEERITPAQLRDEPWVMLDTEPGATHSRSVFHAAGVVPTVAFRSPSYELARSLVGRGLGYTLHIHRPAGDLSHEGRQLVVRPLVTDAPVESATLAWSARIRPSPPARAVIAAARAVWADGLARTDGTPKQSATPEEPTALSEPARRAPYGAH
ncbi:LysR substrate-binding domain-containing protein [Herbiconiux moechotypicola]|uniref:LysR substrate-binding domain-containing protein n=1 Tax=Herbiconiux moechotypicola TaxID=637393 RepID=A0ABN3DXX7_9MICO|nr:LysR substrate-binding domain-containing protein [Herbiconiux moechotypicola]MCS5730852.1 LysR substrate-binding domain-containing protein [Herbiconiux moechotypicola]